MSIGEEETAELVRLLTEVQGDLDADDPAYDSVADLLDRLVGWCPPGMRIGPLPPGLANGDDD